MHLFTLPFLLLLLCTHFSTMSFLMLLKCIILGLSSFPVCRWFLLTCNCFLIRGVCYTCLHLVDWYVCLSKVHPLNFMLCSHVNGFFWFSPSIFLFPSSLSCLWILFHNLSMCQSNGVCIHISLQVLRQLHITGRRENWIYLYHFLPYFLDRVSLWTWSALVRLQTAGLSNPLVSAPTIGVAGHLAFCVCAGDVISGSHACALPTSPSATFLNFLF